MARTFLLPCRNCATKIPVSNSQAGEVINCPNCQAANQVPTLRELNQLESSDSDLRPVADRREASRATWGGPRGLVLAVCLGISVVAISRTVYYSWGRTTIDTRGSVEEMIENLNQVVDKKDVRELLADWTQSNSFTLDEKNPPNFFYNQKAAEYVDSQIYKSAVVSVIAVLGAIATMLVWPKPSRK